MKSCADHFEGLTKE